MDVLNAMRCYAAVVTNGSFTAAAERLGMSKALVSKYVALLEDHLGVRLLHRTTRRLNMTETGRAYHQHCLQLLEDLDELEAAVRHRQAAPRGLLKVAAPTAFGEHQLARAVADYLDQQPEVSVELVLADRFVNLIDEGFDLAVRIGALADSSLIARRLGPARVVLCASHDYLERAGMPTHPRDLTAHRCVIDSNIQPADTWPFREQGHDFGVKVDGRFRANSAGAVRELLLAGQGIGLCPAHVVEEDLHAGHLAELLPEFEALEYGIYAVYPQQRHLATKVRSFVDFLVKRFGVGG